MGGHPFVGFAVLQLWNSDVSHVCKIFLHISETLDFLIVSISLVICITFLISKVLVPRPSLQPFSSPFFPPPRPLRVSFLSKGFLSIDPWCTALVLVIVVIVQFVPYVPFSVCFFVSMGNHFRVLDFLLRLERG